MNRKLAPLVLVAGLLAAGCGSPGTLTTELVAPAHTPTHWTTDVPPAFDPVAPVTAGETVPVQVPTVDAAAVVVEPVRKAVVTPDAGVQRKADVQVRKASVQRKAVVVPARKADAPEARKADVVTVVPVAAVVPAPVVVERATRVVADPPVVVQPAPDHQDAPHIARGTRDLKDPPVVVNPTPDASLPGDDVATTQEKER